MVFEYLVVDFLNRYLKPYVKHFDSTQLKLGIWKGNSVRSGTSVCSPMLSSSAIQPLCMSSLPSPVLLYYVHVLGLHRRTYKYMYVVPVVSSTFFSDRNILSILFSRRMGQIGET